MDRIGGRIWTTEKDAFGYSIDLGPSIVTGKQGNPVTTLCKQLDMEMRGVRVKAPLYSPDGEVVSDAVDEAIEELYNDNLQKSKSWWERTRGSAECDGSLGETLQSLLQDTLQRQAKSLSELERALYNWNLANLEYACASELSSVSVLNWDQDDGNEWLGEHCILPAGYGPIASSLAEGLEIRLNCEVSAIRYDQDSVTVQTRDGVAICGDAVIVTVSLGVLKANTITFDPPLPDWKASAILEDFLSHRALISSKFYF